ncbi:dnaJ homolog subfamily C member 25 homolog [Babylonia areolata]|uniref:dnaJ homolog subfamily C member 25 homolog n=1 Tax=Babylonia areolata TaxID=304850 RepID=UPI003FD4A33C
MAFFGRQRISWLLIFLSCVSSTHAFIEGLYCGTENCYDILGVTREATKSDIVKAYRKLAKKWHPDMHKKQEDKEKAGEMFTKIANAYEILKDEEQRSDYDYMLDNPEEHYSHYYRYYRRRVTPKVDVRLVIVVSITVISIIQYLGALNNYNTAISYLCKEPKYRSRAMDIAKNEGLVNNNKKKKRSMTKEELKQEEEALIRKIIEEKMDIRGGYSRPKYTDVLWVQLFLLPYYLVHYMYWWGRWVWLFSIRGQDYGEEEQLYLIRKYLKLNSSQWDAVEDHEKEEYLSLELWKKDKFVAWKEKKDEEMKIKLAESARYKSYRRYMKKGGPGQMTFGPE